MITEHIELPDVFHPLAVHVKQFAPRPQSPGWHVLSFRSGERKTIAKYGTHDEALAVCSELRERVAVYWALHDADVEMKDYPF